MVDSADFSPTTFCGFQFKNRLRVGGKSLNHKWFDFEMKRISIEWFINQAPFPYVAGLVQEPTGEVSSAVAAPNVFSDFIQSQ